MATATQGSETIAPMSRRLTAAAIDALAIAAIAAMIHFGVGPGAASPLTPGTIVLAGAVAMFYRILTEGTSRGATPGKRALGLRVRAPQGGRIDFAVAALRAFPWWLTGALAGLDPQLIPVGALLSAAAVVPILIDTERRGLHDRMAGTAVIVDRGDGSQ